MKALLQSQLRAIWLFVLLILSQAFFLPESGADTPCALDLVSDQYIIQKINERRPSDGEHIKYELVILSPLSYNSNINSAYNWRLLLESGLNAIKIVAQQSLQELNDHSYRGPNSSPAYKTHTQLLQDNYAILYNYLRSKGFRALTVADIKYSPVVKTDETGQMIKINKLLRVPAMVILPNDPYFDLSYSQITIFNQTVSGVHIDDQTNIRYVGMNAIIGGILDAQPVVDHKQNSKLN